MVILPTKIYQVIGATGYGGITLHYTWTVQFFTTKKEAYKFADTANNWAKGLSIHPTQINSKNVDQPHLYDTRLKELAKHCPFDKNIQIGKSGVCWSVYGPYNLLTKYEGVE